MNLNARATSPLDIREPTEEHERNLTLFEPLAQRRALAIMESMVNHGSCEIWVLGYYQCVFNGTANTNTSPSVLERVLNVH